jgi:replication factor C small subunit
MIDRDVLWVEKWRPRTIKDCILPDSLKNVFQQYVDSNTVPNLLLTGSSGVGKTTSALALCEQTGYDYILLNGSGQDRGIDTVKTKITSFASSISLTGTRKAIIIDEADALTSDSQSAFRGVIEEFAGNCSFIFTCNFKNRIITALHSRCAVIDFALSKADKQAMAVQFMKRTMQILTDEGKEFDKKVVAQLIERFFPDYRRTLNELQRYSAGGKIDIGILEQLSGAKIEELLTFIKAKDFKSMRKWVSQNADTDHQRLMRDLYDKAYDYFEPKSIPILVMILGKYMWQATSCMDQEINTAALLTEILVECQVK